LDQTKVYYRSNFYKTTLVIFGASVLVSLLLLILSDDLGLGALAPGLREPRFIIPANF